MLQSTHFNLNLVEGSDIVNPLVIDRPNYENIDGVMYENESKSIGNATELKSGTIHALTRTKGNQRFFCFTATSNYDAGDTFTVDSVPVTALLPNGTALPDNAYVVNGTVLCSLIGTLLTVYTVGSAIADDALRLEGELPSYYATASNLATVETTANAASTLSINNSNQISEINSKLTWRLLSETISNDQNNPTVVDVSECQEFFVYCKPYYSGFANSYIKLLGNMWLAVGENSSESANINFNFSGNTLSIYGSFARNGSPITPLVTRLYGR